MDARVSLLLALCYLVALVTACENPSQRLEVRIVPNYTPPATFKYNSPYFRAGSSLTLSCKVEGAKNNHQSILYYEWRSTCRGSCFVRGGSSRSVSTSSLHSYDDGVHTCVVYHPRGCTGSASFTVKVTGAGIFLEAPKSKVLPNNSLIVESGGYYTRIPQFRGLSASNRSNVGQLIDPQGRDITSSYTDPFIVSLGSSFEPGTMRVRCYRSLQRNEVGIYTYRTPDENGRTIDVNFGLYTSNSSRPPIVTNLVASIGGTPPFMLNCTTSSSPPTQVIWRKDGQQIQLSDGYKMSQSVLDRVSSSYVSTLSMDGVLDDVVGEYSCAVTNTLGTSNTRNVTVESISITGHEIPIIVGLTRAINCSTALNSSKLEWTIVGIGTGEPVDETYQGQSLVLSLTPQGTQLDGAKITCRVTTTNHKVFEKTVAIVVKELNNLVQIEGPSESIPVGNNASFLCVAKTDFAPTLQWLDQNNNVVASNGTSMWTEQQYTIGRATYKRLVFWQAKSSSRGSYTCKSTISDPPSVNSTNKKIIIKLSSKLVAMEESSEKQHYIGESFTLTCWTYLDDSIDTAVHVSHSWVSRNGSALTSDSQKSISDVTFSDEGYYSSLTFYSLSSSDSGLYSCQSTIQSSHADMECISSSTPQSASVVINAALKVEIRIDYSSPDPEYSPPNYRAASSVRLYCDVTGASRYMYHRWSSTCRNCFASRARSSSISKTFLVASDEGVHTCTVTDRNGNSGSASITMNIVGIGIYVSNSIKTGTGHTTGVQANNSYAIVDTYSSRTSTRFSMYCCSSSRYSNGAIIYPTGARRTSGGYSSYDSITQYSSSHSYAGCIQFKYSGRNRYSGWYYRYYDYTFYFSYSGIYTCAFGNMYSSIALYSRGTRVPEASIVSVQKSTWSANYPRTLRLSATIQYSPPSGITWFKDDTPINSPENISDSNIIINTYASNRRSSYYDVSLEVKDSPDNLVGEYSVSLSNETDSSNETYMSVDGIQISCSSARFIVGQHVTCTCSSDLKPTLIEWYMTGQSSSVCSQQFITSSRSDFGSNDFVFVPTTDDHGKTLVCVTTTPYGKQNTSKDVEVEVPSTWGSVSIELLRDSALQNQNYSLTCTVTSVPGLHLPVSVEWLFPNGSVIPTQGNRTIGNLQRTNYTTSLGLPFCQSSHTYSRSSVSLSFAPIHNSDGGSYKCQAKTEAPWIPLRPAIANSSIITVTTQAKFQLKIYPVTHCSTWNVQTGRELEKSIKKNIEEAVSDLCNCHFSSTTIHSGEFNCLPQSCDSDDNCGSTTTSLGPVVYRAAVNGTSDRLTADQILGYIDTWREESRTLLHQDMVRLGIQGKKKCTLKIDSFKSKRC